MEEEHGWHSTDNERRRAAQEVHSSAEAGDFAGLAIYGQRGGCVTATWDSSHDLVSMEETVGPGSSRVSQREQGKGQPSDQGTSERESEAQRYGDMAHSGADALEKKDEPGLMGRMSDQSDSSEQRQRILDTVQRLKSQGVSTSCILNGLGIPRSTFYFWRSEKDRKTRPTGYHALLEYVRLI